MRGGGVDKNVRIVPTIFTWGCDCFDDSSSFKPYLGSLSKHRARHAPYGHGDVLRMHNKDFNRTLKIVDSAQGVEHPCLREDKPHSTVLRVFCFLILSSFDCLFAGRICMSCAVLYCIVWAKEPIEHWRASRSSVKMPIIVPVQYRSGSSQLAREG